MSDEKFIVIVDRFGREFERRPVGFTTRPEERPTRPQTDGKEVASARGSVINYDPYWNHCYTPF